MKTHLDKLISGYIDGELTPRQLGRVERHLKDCAECREEVAAMRQLKTSVAATAPAMTMDVSREFFWSQIRRQIEAESGEAATRERPFLARFFGWGRVQWAVATAVVVVAVAAFALLRGEPRKEAPPLQYVDVEEVSTEVPYATVAAFRSSVAGVSVIWLTGLEPIEDENGDEL